VSGIIRGLMGGGEEDGWRRGELVHKNWVVHLLEIIR
jgi:hypothetical protein